LGSRATRTREGLDEILAPAGFVPVSWEPIVIEWSGTPEQVDGRLPCGMRINIAPTRLTNSEEASDVPPGSGIG
jgi:hypothetical protein